jgi:exosome complex component RRP4
MRTLFVEGDLVSAEVQNVLSDGSLSIHARSLRYGKLENGVLITVPSALVKRMKQHFISLPKEVGIDMLVGCNGYIWIMRSIPDEWKQELITDEESDGQLKTETLTLLRQKHCDVEVSVEERMRIARVRNAVEMLHIVFRYIDEKIVMSVYEESLRLGLSVEEMLHTDNVIRCTEKTR